jgi:hypothetical protein
MILQHVETLMGGAPRSVTEIPSAPDQPREVYYVWRGSSGNVVLLLEDGRVKEAGWWPVGPRDHWEIGGTPTPPSNRLRSWLRWPGAGNGR